jgi:hypothetical protein
MAATPARIGFVLEPYRRAVSESPAAKLRHGNLARESADPIETWFASLADAELRADERQDLFAPERRRFDVTVSEIDGLDELLAAGEAITVNLVDDERGLAKRMLVTSLTIDIETQRAALTIWG